MAPQQPIGLKAVLRAIDTHVADIEDVVDMATHPEEFELETPVPDMAQVYTYLHEGVSCEEMLSIVKAGELPELNKPETQLPLLQIIDRLGQIAVVSEVIAEESARGKSPFDSPS